MDNYMAKINSNHVFNSESSEDLYYLYSDYTSDNNIQKGGKRGINENDDNDISKNTSLDNIRAEYITRNNEIRPTGGFPPIYIVSSKEGKEELTTKNRQLASRKSSISIKDILKGKKT